VALLNPDNLHLRYGYQRHLREARGADEKTIQLVVAAIAGFDEFIAHRDYLDLSETDSVRFKEWLTQSHSRRDGERLARSTIVHRLKHIRDYLSWVKTRKGYGKLKQDVIDYLTPNRRMVISARRPADRIGPPPQVVETVIRSMPQASFLERRNRALIAFLYLTGVRDGVIPDLRLRHLDLEAQVLTQDGAEVRTKFGKSMQTFFFPIPDDIRQMVVDWIAELTAADHDGDDPIFPASQGAVQATSERDRITPLKSAQPVRVALKTACAAAGVPYFYPHMIRKTLAQLGDEMCQDMRRRKAWSQNLGHESMITTDASYAKLSTSEIQQALRETQNQTRQAMLERFQALPPDRAAIIESIMDSWGLQDRHG
jgi:integrase